MDWIIQSKDGIAHYTTYDSFLVALRYLFDDPQKQFISATLADGTGLDEAAAKKLLGGGGYHRRGRYRRDSNLVTSGQTLGPPESAPRVVASSSPRTPPYPGT
jgi:hypothetical protein